MGDEADLQIGGESLDCDSVVLIQMGHGLLEIGE